MICTNTASGVWAQGLGVEFMGLLYIQNIFTDCPDAPAEVFEHNFLYRVEKIKKLTKGKGVNTIFSV